MTYHKALIRLALSKPEPLEISYTVQRLTVIGISASLPVSNNPCPKATGLVLCYELLNPRSISNHPVHFYTINAVA